ncbi:hypothetical protein J4H86_02460 [Spiractinospora alimapuensis]|uniref:VOC family protein n=1 Tax=Spiractinospora alimapuensis TaxID=2820884 RepID=UPI001F3558B0|nr:VOC family protein [Spiractinospora alimapuensis]QVQ52711.1 hypothetical protein J4H86_02460 [Spiractinospora alimapuensis]
MLSLDAIELGVPEVPTAREFYVSALLSPATEDDQTVRLDLYGTGQVGLRDVKELADDLEAGPDTSGFRGYVMSYIVRQPREVQVLVDAAVAQGATVLRPPKKGFFGGFSAVYRAPDGAVWKLAAPTKKDTAPAADPPTPTETGVLLGVADPTVSKVFYTALGMTVDRDYGTKFIDFVPAKGSCRFGLMTRAALAKDAGVAAAGTGFPAAVLTSRRASRDEVDAVLSVAATAGADGVSTAAEDGSGGYAGRFTDPDGFTWTISSP